VDPALDDGGEVAALGGITVAVEVTIDGDAEPPAKLKLQETSIRLQEISSFNPMVILILVPHHSLPDNNTNNTQKSERERDSEACAAKEEGGEGES